MFDLLARGPSTPELSVLGITSAEEAARLLIEMPDSTRWLLRSAERFQNRFSEIGRDSRVSILIADDEDDIRNLLSQFLSMRGYAVSFATNGRKAVFAVEQNRAVQIVLLDVSMSLMGGMEALRHIVSFDPHPSVIMMTAVADREIARQAMKTGAFDYILKPFDSAAIEASITACLSCSEYQKQPWWKHLRKR